MRSFGDIMKDARKAAGMTLEDVANKLDTHKGYISGIERGRTAPPSDKYMPKIAKMFGYDEIALLALAHAEKAPEQVREVFLEAVDRNFKFPQPETLAVKE